MTTLRDRTRVSKLRRDRNAIMQHINSLRRDLPRSDSPEELLDTIEDYRAQLQRIERILESTEGAE